jgi:hypothetical protein
MYKIRRSGAFKPSIQSSELLHRKAFSSNSDVTMLTLKAWSDSFKWIVDVTMRPRFHGKNEHLYDLNIAYIPQLNIAQIRKKLWLRMKLGLR